MKPLVNNPLIIAIDFDGTWTADPGGWRQFYQLMVARGHTLILATGRSHYTEDMARASLPPGMPMVFCGGDLKQDACLKAGYTVHIWIDDMPGMIQHCHILLGELTP